MMDGSDAVSDWPMINLALNATNGASWVGIQQGAAPALETPFTQAWLL